MVDGPTLIVHLAADSAFWLSLSSPRMTRQLLNARMAAPTTTPACGLAAVQLGILSSNARVTPCATNTSMRYTAPHAQASRTVMGAPRWPGLKLLKRIAVIQTTNKPGNNASARNGI